MVSKQKPPVRLPNTHSRAEWLAARRKGIGSSDAAPACGASPYGTPLAVYANKAWGVEQEETEPMRIGAILEPVISQMYADRFGCHVGPEPMLQHPDHPWMLANLDRTRTDTGRIVECKNSSTDGWGEEGTDEVPVHIFLQVQHQQAVYDPDEPADVAALVRGNSFRVYTINPSQTIHRKLIETEGALWALIQEGRQPPPDFLHPSTVDLLNDLNEPVLDRQIRTLSEEAAEFVAGYELIGKQIKDLEAQRKELKARVIAEMGTHWAYSLPDGRVVRRKMVEVRGYEVAPRTQTEFRIVTRKTADADADKANAPEVQQ